MEGRGRKSAASLTVVPAGIPARMEPPQGLTQAQGELWREIVATKPADWFTADSAPLLKEMVRAAVMCDLLAVQIEAALEGGESGEVKALLDMRDKEAKRLASLETKLRLTPQSRYTPQAAATADKKASGARPWQR
jgi:hypothetical protein